MTYAEFSRMSHIRDRNIYSKTDQLYQPLRNALRKLTISQSLLFPQQNMSRLGKTMRSLSPSEVETIKRNLYIPINKQLIPTRNLHKILGKNFTAVDVTERVRQALTPEQFTRIKHRTIQEIIYEIKDEPIRNQNIYTSRATIPNLLYISPHSLKESKVVQVQQHRQSQMNLLPKPINNRQTRACFPVLPSPNRESQVVYTQHLQPNRQSQVNFTKQPFRQSLVNVHFQSNRQNSTNIYTQYQPSLSINIPQNSFFKNVNQRQSLLYMDRTQNRVSSPVAQHDSSKENTNRSLTSITALKNDVNINQGIFSSVKSGNENHSKLYDFKGSMVTDRTAKNTRRIKDEYKYNLFSALDEAGNTKCQKGCCHSNQIVASKIQHNPWK